MPSLSTDGWVNDSIQIADYMMSHFFLSEYSQTYLYPNNVASLPYLIEINKGSPQKTAQAIEQTLTQYFENYFKDVTVQCRYRNDSTDDTRASVDVFIEYSDSDGVQHSFGKSAEMVNGKFNKIVQINNLLGEG